MSEEHEHLLALIRRLHEQIRDAVVAACERSSMEELARVAHDETGDTIFAIDRVSEEVLIRFFEREAGAIGGLVLIAEGIEGGQTVIGASDASAARWRIIVDPIDGTRGIMYQKRPAWVLTGVAPNHGEATSLADIELAVQTEIPLLKQHLCDCAWALRGRGARAERWNRLTRERAEIPLRPSAAASIEHGYAMLSRFFPGARDELAAMDEEIVRGALGVPAEGKVPCFDDQYACTGGQLYELMTGRDRFNADVRPLLLPILLARGLGRSHCCHPYDICTELVAREAGVLVTDARGEPLRNRLSVDEDVSWAGYANDAIRRQIEPLLQAALEKRGL